MRYKFIGIENGYIKYDNYMSTDFIGYDFQNNLTFFKNGKRHREDGPAVIYRWFNSFPEWWLNNSFYTSLTDYLKELNKIRTKTPKEIKHIKREWEKIGWPR
jgi:hypothetical protein